VLTANSLHVLLAAHRDTALLPPSPEKNPIYVGAVAIETGNTIDMMGPGMVGIQKCLNFDVTSGRPFTVDVLLVHKRHGSQSSMEHERRKVGGPPATLGVSRISLREFVLQMCGSVIDA